MKPEIVIPILMGCAMLWWIGRGISVTARLIVAVVTLAIVGAVVMIERGV